MPDRRSLLPLHFLPPPSYFTHQFLLLFAYYTYKSTPIRMRCYIMDVVFQRMLYRCIASAAYTKPDQPFSVVLSVISISFESMNIDRANDTINISDEPITNERMHSLIGFWISN